MGKQKYEQEIEEILSKYYDEAEHPKKKPPEERPRQFTQPPRWPNGSAGTRTQGTPSFRPGTPMPNWKRFSSGQYMLAAFGLAMAAIFLSRFLPGLVVNLMVILAVVLFLIPIVLYHRSGTSSGGWSPREEKRWRGQVIDYKTRRNISDDPLEGIKRWFRRK